MHESLVGEKLDSLLKALRDAGEGVGPRFRGHAAASLRLSSAGSCQAELWVSCAH